MVTRFLLSEFGASFAMRGRGEELRKQALKRAGASSTLIVDFAGVQRVSYAFADEFVGKLVAEGDDLTVEVTHASGIVGRTVEAQCGVAPRRLPRDRPTCSRASAGHDALSISSKSRSTSAAACSTSVGLKPGVLASSPA